MSTIRALLSNYVLNVSLLAWFCAQALKTILHLIKTRQLRMERMVGAGGMPSAHSASVWRHGRLPFPKAWDLPLRFLPFLFCWRQSSCMMRWECAVPPESMQR